MSQGLAVSTFSWYWFADVYYIEGLASLFLVMLYCATGFQGVLGCIGRWLLFLGFNCFIGLVVCILLAPIRISSSKDIIGRLERDANLYALLEEINKDHAGNW